MSKIFDDFFNLLIELEGGVSNNINDNGGLTKYGITSETFNSVREKYGISKTSVTDITISDAKIIYLNGFFQSVKPLQNIESYYNCFDMCVNSGYPNYLKMKLCLGDSINNIVTLYAYRTNYFVNICNKNPSQKKFFDGWLNRLEIIRNHFKPNENK